MLDKPGGGHYNISVAMRQYEPLAQSAEHLTFNQRARGSNPRWFTKRKRRPKASFSFWCGRWDLNPHVIDTRTSNVPVCRFQHFRSNRIDCERYNTTIRTQKSSLLRKFYSRIAKKRPAPPEVSFRGRRAVYEEKRKWQIRRGSFRAAGQGSATSPWQPPASYRLQRHRGGRR